MGSGREHKACLFLLFFFKNVWLGEEKKKKKQKEKKSVPQHFGEQTKSQKRHSQQLIPTFVRKIIS